MSKRVQCNNCHVNGFMDEGGWSFTGYDDDVEIYLCPDCSHGLEKQCPCGCGNGRDGKCVYEGAYTHPFFSEAPKRKEIEQKARALVNQTVYDLRSSLNIGVDLVVLRRALELVQDTGSGYGSGKTAEKMIKSAIRRAEMPKGAMK